MDLFQDGRNMKVAAVSEAVPPESVLRMAE